jgi:ankyrin repeat protein
VYCRVALTAALRVQGGEMDACRDGDVEEVERLLNADPGLLDGNRNTMYPLLNFASMHGHVEVVRMLLKRGADMSPSIEYGRTALYEAAWKGHTPVVTLLMERGADPNVADRDGCTPLMQASSGGHVETVRALLEGGADPAVGDSHALYDAINGGKLEVVRLLLGHPSAKVMINKPGFFGRTPLSVALQRGHPGIVKEGRERLINGPTTGSPWIATATRCSSLMVAHGLGLPTRTSWNVWR